MNEEEGDVPRRSSSASGHARSGRVLVVAQSLLFWAIVFLPFQQAFTLDLGFPLKITEILAIAGIVASLIAYRQRPRLTIPVWLIVGLGAVVILSSCWNLLTGSTVDVSAEMYPRGVTFDLLLYTGYAGFALAFCIAIALFMDAQQVLKALAWAVRLAAIYVLLQLLLWSFGSSLLEIINGNIQLGSLYGVRLPRNGPFLEGNYLGFFAIAGFFATLKTRDWVGVGLAALLFFYSQSTSAFVAACGAAVAIVLLRPTRRKALIAGAALVVVGATAAIVPPVTRFVTAQLTKLGIIENNLGEAFGYSLRGRTANAETGFAMAGDHPIFGVGQGRYAAHYWDYLDRSGLPDNFGTNVVRPIANNVYAQIAAETGFIALLIFVALLGYLLLRARRESDATLGLIVATAVGLIAFPAWTGLPIWTAIGAVIVLVTRPLPPDDVQAEPEPVLPGSDTIEREEE